MTSNERRFWGGALLLLGDVLTLSCLLAGGLGGFFSVRQFPVEPWAMAVWCVVLSAGAAALHTWRYGSWTALGLLAGEALLVWRCWDALQPGVWLSGVGEPGGGLEFALLAFALALLLGWVVVRARCWYLAALAVTAPLLPAIVRGVLPDWTALVACTAGWLSMLLTSLYSRRDRAALAKGTLLNLGGALALLLLLTAALPREGYDRPPWATNARDSLVDGISRRFRGAFEGEMPTFLEGYLDIGGTGGSSSSDSGPYFVVEEDGRVDLLAAGPRRYAERPVLRVDAGRSQAGRTMYLFGNSAMEYTGSSWEAGPAYEDRGTALSSGEPVRYSASYGPARTAPEIPVETVTIRHLAAAGKTAYYPYRLVRFKNMDVALSGSGWAERTGGQWTYQVAYRPGGPEDSYSPLDPQYGEEAYRDYVYGNYLALPLETQNFLLKTVFGSLAYSIALMPDNAQYPLACADAVAAVLAQAAVYSLDVPAPPPGTDFVEHFLSEGRGYCVHFATTGALLLRMLGVPARYAAGYAARLDGQGRADVLDSNAHAWVEIYLDGYGWHPVEMTPGAAGLLGDALPVGGLEEPDSPEESHQPPEEEEEEDQGVPELPEESSELPEEEPDSPEGPDSVPEDNPAPAAALDWGWLRALAAVLAALAVPAAGYRLGLVVRSRSQEQPDTNRSCIAAYRRCLRTAPWGGGMPPELEELARKARFSQHTLEGGERERAWLLVEEAVRELAGRLPWWKRAVFRCLGPLF